MNRKGRPGHWSRKWQRASCRSQPPRLHDIGAYAVNI